MSCDEIRDQLIETARARELSSDLRKIVFSHAAGCASCARHLENEQRLTHALSELSISAEAAPARLEQAILRQMKVVPMRRVKPARWVWSGAAAAAIAAGMFLAVNTRVHVPQAQTPVVDRAVADSDGFMPLPYAAELGPEEQAEMVRVQIPRQALLSMGVPVDGENSDEQIQADVLVGMDGTARAIRVAD